MSLTRFLIVYSYLDLETFIFHLPNPPSHTQTPYSKSLPGQSTPPQTPPTNQPQKSLPSQSTLSNTLPWPNTKWTLILFHTINHPPLRFQLDATSCSWFNILAFISLKLYGILRQRGSLHYNGFSINLVGWETLV